MSRKAIAISVFLVILALSGCTGRSAPAGTVQATTAAMLPPTATPIPFASSALGTPGVPASPLVPTPSPALATPGAPTPSPTSTPRNVFGVVTPLKLRVHEKPGVSSPVSGYLNGGEVVRILGRDSSGTWLYVAAENGEKGWVSGSYVSVLGKLDSVPEMAKSPSPSMVPSGRTRTPKGKFFYVSGWGIYRLDMASGNVEFVTGGIEPAVSPDGERLAFVRGGGEKGLWIRNLKAGTERLLFGGFDVRTPRWSPDGDRLYFSIQNETRPAQHKCIPFINRCWDIPEDKRWHLAVVTFPEGVYTDLPSDYHSFAPNPLRDGNVLYQNEHGLAVTSVGSSPKQFLEKPWLLLPWVRPQEDELVAQYRLPQGWVVVLVSKAGDLRILTKPDPLSENKQDFVSPAWSPDGRYLVMLHRLDGGRWEILIVDGVGRLVRRIRPEPSPDYPFDGAQAIVWGK